MNRIETTNKDLPLSNYIKGYNLIIPKGTRITHQTACGEDKQYNFIDDFSWIPKTLGMLRHDAIYYGINIEVEHITQEGT